MLRWPGKALAAFFGLFDRSDVLVLVGLSLIALAWWETSRLVALGVPGAVLVWFGLPSRPPFIDRGPRGPTKGQQ